MLTASTALKTCNVFVGILVMIECVQAGSAHFRNMKISSPDIAVHDLNFWISS